MLYFSITKKLILFIFCLILGLLALPNFVNNDALPSFFPKNTLNLGLDLRGGSYLLLEVDTETIKKEKSEILLDDIRSVLRKNRIKYTGLKITKSGVRVSIIDEEQINTAKNLINSINQVNPNNFLTQNVSELNIESSGSTFDISFTNDALRSKYRSAVNQSIEIVRRRIDGLGVTEPSIQRQGNNRILLEVPGLDDPARLKDLLGQTAKLNFRMVDTSISISDALRGKIPPRSEILYDKDAIPWLVNKKILVSGERLADAQAGFDQMTNTPVVNFRFDVTGGKSLQEQPLIMLANPLQLFWIMKLFLLRQ